MEPFVTRQTMTAKREDWLPEVCYLNPASTRARNVGIRVQSTLFEVAPLFDAHCDVLSLCCLWQKT